MARLPRTLVPVVVLIVAAACGNPEGTPMNLNPGAAPTTTAAVREATVVGQNIAFDVTELDTAVGERLSIVFENRDAGVLHNLHVTDTATDDAMTEIEVGVVTQTLEVTFDRPGRAEYFCDVHPQQMRGTITVDG